MDAVIDVRGLRKRYGDVQAVQDVSLRVMPGEIFGIVGPNGAGKTTTVEIAQGLTHADAGTVRLLGLDPFARGDVVRQRVGTQLQQAVLPDALRVREALELYATFYARPTPPDVLLEQWELSDKRDATFDALSGGQRQRLFIALALVGSPDVVFLDELTTGLDPAARRSTWEHVRRIRDGGVTVVLVTHFMDEAEHLCDRVAVIDGGRVVASGTPAELISRVDGSHTVRFGPPPGFEPGWLHDLPSVLAVEVDATAHTPTVVVRGTGAVLGDVATTLAAHGDVPDDLSVDRAGLEDAFLALTNRARPLSTTTS